MSPTLKALPAINGREASCVSSRARYLAAPALALASTSGTSGCWVQLGEASVARCGCKLSDAQSDHCQADARASALPPARSEPATSIKYEQMARDSDRLRSPQVSA